MDKIQNSEITINSDPENEYELKYELNSYTNEGSHTIDRGLFFDPVTLSHGGINKVVRIIKS